MSCPLGDNHSVSIYSNPKHINEEGKLQCEYCEQYILIKDGEKYWRCDNCNVNMCPMCLSNIIKDLNNPNYIELQTEETTLYKLFIKRHQTKLSKITESSKKETEAAQKAAEDVIEFDA